MENENTRPTLDRVKESLFNIINSRIEDSIVLDLFAGSGAIGIEFLSRGAKKAYMCDKSKEAIKFVKDNVNKTKLQDKAIIANKDYKEFLMDLYKSKEKFDIIFLDPPYEKNLAVESVSLILEYKLLNNDGIIIIETDQKEREIKELEEINVEIYDTRKYGRANLIFLVERG
ncbi:MAG: 16S rRNA (guanine(966)-N(2))-methyltransferase RsmD [Clostridia bacterium]|nr:16S rRNA (guanine(966)-N(2))-methyltransferase RsmD [Clostridia bacterium]